jgi:hypothetical protein
MAVDQPDPITLAGATSESESSAGSVMDHIGGWSIAGRPSLADHHRQTIAGRQASEA